MRNFDPRCFHADVDESVVVDSDETREVWATEKVCGFDCDGHGLGCDCDCVDDWRMMMMTLELAALTDGTMRMMMMTMTMKKKIRICGWNDDWIWRTAFVKWFKGFIMDRYHRLQSE